MALMSKLLKVQSHLNEVMGSTEYGGGLGLCCHVQHQADVGVEVLRRQEYTCASMDQVVQGSDEASEVEEASCLRDGHLFS